ncbi:protein YIPF7 isoform X1 [Mixophyes fleayi]|uniref:protein YIPF7 isoform X1 n=1 Tax=Mixophyes fleayi TaxID=3061075 RepID=UPI003F4E3B1E
MDQFDSDFYQSDYIIDDTDQGLSITGRSSMYDGNRTRETEFLQPGMISSPLDQTGYVYEDPSYNTLYNFQKNDSSEDELPLLEGRKDTFWLCVYNEYTWLPGNSCFIKSDECHRCLTWMCCQCLGLLPSAYGDTFLLCHCVFFTGNRWDNLSSFCNRMVQFLSFKNIHHYVGNGRTAASCSISLCIALWTFCIVNCVLKCLCSTDHKKSASVSVFLSDSVILCYKTHTG